MKELTFVADDRFRASSTIDETTGELITFEKAQKIVNDFRIQTIISNRLKILQKH